MPTDRTQNVATRWEKDDHLGKRRKTTEKEEGKNRFPEGKAEKKEKVDTRPRGRRLEKILYQNPREAGTDHGRDHQKRYKEMQGHKGRSRKKIVQEKRVTSAGL